MTDTQGNDHNERLEPEDISEIAALFRTVPRIKPGRGFRARMSIYCIAPSLACRIIERRRTAPHRPAGRGREADMRIVRPVRPAGIAAAAAVFLIIAFGVFGALTLAARTSQPGNPLYSIKRLSENVELIFTWDTEKKAEKNLTLAQRRLSELDHMITENKLDPVSLATVAGDYTARRGAVEDVLQKDGTVKDAQNVASRLKVVETTEENIEKRLATAGANAALSPASGALVTVRDAGGRPALNAGKNSVRMEAGAGGQVKLRADLNGKDEARNLEVLVELGGRSQVLPLFPAAKPAGGKLAATVSPRISSIEVGRPQLFTLTVKDGDGTGLRRREVRLMDRTGTSSINGVGGEVSLLTDRYGSCSFSVTKNSLDRVSRITANILNGSEYDLGEVLTLGGLRTVAGKDTQAGVSVKSSGPASGPQNLVLENGLIRLTAGSGRRGYIVDGITGIAQPGKAGPLYDPLAAGGDGNEDASVRISGPRLAFSNPEAAGYVLDLKAPDGLSKSYQVVLARGKPYVTVSCRIEHGPTADPALSEREPYMEVSRLETDTAAELELSGREVRPVTSDDPIQQSFQVGKPYAVVESGGCPSILACPINSKTYPDRWTLGRSYIAPTVRSASGGSPLSSDFTFVLGTGDSHVIDSLKKQSLRGIEVSLGEEGRQSEADGFAVEASPSLDALRQGRQAVSVFVYKRYKKVLDAQ